MVLAFAIDPATGESPESVRRKREMIRSLLGAQRAPQNVGEGLSALGDGIVAAILDGRADKAESAGLASASSVFGTLTGGGDFPAAPATDASVASSAPSRDTSRTGSTIDFANAGSPADLQPHQRALLDTIAGPESAGKYDVIYGGGRFSDFSDHPRKAVPIGSGPNAGKTSSAAGKYQFLGSTWDDQAKKLGLTDFSPASQDKAAWNLASESYRNATGGDLDAVLRSGDTNAIAGVGKALAPIWTSLPGGIEQGTNTSRFLKAYNGYLGQGGPSAALETMAAQDPVRVASLDPAAGVFEAGAEQGLSPDNPGLQALARIAASEGTEAAPKVPGVQIAQALSGTPEMAGNAPSARRQPSIPELLGGLGNEWMSPAQQKILGVMLEQQMQQEDPAYQMGLEKTRTELDLLKNPRLSPYEDAQLQLKRSEAEAAAAKAKQDQSNADRTFTSEDADRTADNTRADQELNIKQLEYLLKTQPDFYAKYVQQEEAAGRTPLGVLDYATRLKGENKPSAVQEYEYAKAQGFPGTFQDWEASKKGGMSLQVDPATGAVTFQQGQNIKPLTEGQSKDTVFSTRAAGALPLIDKYGDALTSLGQEALSGIPILGNYLRSDEHQQAEQAGKEFLQAILRKDTGAAITPAETSEYGTVYLPRPGDSDAVLAQKKQSRERALKAIEAGMPPQAILAQEKALSESTALPEGVTEEDIQHTMKLHGVTREQVLERLRGGGNAP